MIMYDAPIKAKRAIIQFCDNQTIEGYRMPNGEYRIGLSSASEALGYSKEWLGRNLKRNGNQIKALQDMGFSGKIEKVATKSIKGQRESRTITLDDFKHLINYAANKGKKKAIALQSALMEIALSDFFRDAFKEAQLSVDEKRQLFYKAYAESLSFEDWLEMDRQDVKDLKLFGNQELL